MLTKVYTKSVIVLTIVHPRSKVWTIHAPKCEQLFTLQNGNPNLKPPTINNSNGLGKLVETSVYQIRKKKIDVSSPKWQQHVVVVFVEGLNSTLKIPVSSCSCGAGIHISWNFLPRGQWKKNQMRNKLNMRYN